MISSSRLFSFILLLISLHFTILVIAAEPLYNICSKDGNYTTNSTYQRNINSLLSSLNSNNEIDYGFYNLSAGQSPDRVNSIALCRGDLTQNECRTCLNDSTVDLPRLCPVEKEAIVWYDNCMLRYSNDSIFGEAEGISFYLCNPNNVSDVDTFNQVLGSLLTDLRNDAAAGDSRRKFAAGRGNFTSFQPIFALVQCTPDLTQLECSSCLDAAIADVPSYCGVREGGRLVGPSCNLRYETYQFYTTPANAPPPSSSPPPANFSPPPSSSTAKEGNKSDTTKIAIAIVIPLVAFAIIILSICVFFRLRKSRKMQNLETADGIDDAESLQFDFGTVRAATDDFSNAHKLGQGGFGAVYKGKLPNGHDIAVKRLSANSGQGDQEFKNEVRLVAKLQHRNLVRLHGFSLEGSERLLIYEFVPNTSLDHFLFDPTKRGLLDWQRRYKIIGGIARGILYLHEDSRLRIIHRDLKASNILLDAEMNPKISDFGMARLFVMDQTQGNTSRIVGTYGYMSPEYAMHGLFSVKSDVYSFGVLVLETVSGQKNAHFQHGEDVVDLISYAWESWEEGTAPALIDRTLESGSRSEIMRCIHIGLLCVQENPADRPTMASVVLMLSSFSLTLPVPSKPGFFNYSSIGQAMPIQSQNFSGATESKYSQSISTQVSVNDDSITELGPR